MTDTFGSRREPNCFVCVRPAHWRLHAPAFQHNRVGRFACTRHLPALIRELLAWAKDHDYRPSVEIREVVR